MFVMWTIPIDICMLNIITKLPESGDLYGNITEFGVVEDHLSLQGEGDLPPHQIVVPRCFEEVTMIFQNKHEL